LSYKKKISKKEQKHSKGKANTHSTAQPKAYGIMAGQKGGFAKFIVLPCHPSGLIPFPFGFSACPP